MTIACHRRSRSRSHSTQTKRLPIRNFTMFVFIFRTRATLSDSINLDFLFCDTVRTVGLTSRKPSKQKPFEMWMRNRFHSTIFSFDSRSTVSVFTLSWSVTNFFPPLASQWIGTNVYLELFSDFSFFIILIFVRFSTKTFSSSWQTSDGCRYAAAI